MIHTGLGFLKAAPETAGRGFHKAAPETAPNLSKALGYGYHSQGSNHLHRFSCLKTHPSHTQGWPISYYGS